MTAHGPISPNESPGIAAKGAEPKVFVRTFSTPPGLPWDQSRAAALEARSGAPLPLAEVIYQVRRLEPWVLRRPAKFAALYVRLTEAGSSLESTVEMHGRSVRVHFLSATERNRRARRLGLIAVAAGSLALVASGAVTSALAVRHETAERLDALDQIATAKSKSMRQTERQRLVDQSLDAQGAGSLKLSNVLGDLAWASAAKSPDAHIEALHWDHGHMAVEVRGDAEPFRAGDRTIIKASKPLRPGIWLWGVGVEGQGP